MTIDEVIGIAKKEGLNKEDTIKLVSKVYTNSLLAPNNISVSFVRENLDAILSNIKASSNDSFSDFNVDKTILSMDSTNECCYFLPNNTILTNINKALNENIKSTTFQCLYENGIFYINDIDLLNSNNKKTVINKLVECGAININKKLNLLRKIHVN